MKNTLVVNIYGGPGASKTTFMANIFSHLKWNGVEAEMAPEYAKELVWEGELKKLSKQKHVFKKQKKRITRVLGQTDVVITDSPLLLSIVYDSKKSKRLQKKVLSSYNEMNNINFFINRAREYNPVGRLQTEEEAKEIDNKVKNVLDTNNFPYIEIIGKPENAQLIIDIILEKIS